MTMEIASVSIIASLNSSNTTTMYDSASVIIIAAIALIYGMGIERIFSNINDK